MEFLAFHASAVLLSAKNGRVFKCARFDPMNKYVLHATLLWFGEKPSHDMDQSHELVVRRVFFCLIFSDESDRAVIVEFFF